VGTVAQLWIYPVKSCKGVQVNAAECTAMGLRSGHLRDRYVGPGAASTRDSEARERWGVDLSGKCHLPLDESKADKIKGRR
jgi:hypothetical protein